MNINFKFLFQFLVSNATPIKILFHIKSLFYSWTKTVYVTWMLNQSGSKTIKIKMMFGTLIHIKQRYQVNEYPSAKSRAGCTRTDIMLTMLNWCDSPTNHIQIHVEGSFYQPQDTFTNFLLNLENSDSHYSNNIWPFNLQCMWSQCTCVHSILYMK